MIWCITHGAEGVDAHTNKVRNPAIRGETCDLFEITQVEPGPKDEIPLCPVCDRPWPDHPRMDSTNNTRVHR